MRKRIEFCSARRVGVGISLLLGLSACSGSDVGVQPIGNTGGDANTAVGGASSFGGTAGKAGSAANGGNPVTGGASGVASSATGGARATGGAPATGGNKATGGAPTTGGALSTGGNNATGGSLATGGSKATGGSNAMGGTPAAGGSSATGGTPATGGSKASGGTGADTGGSKAGGGTSSTGGNQATGGTIGAGGSECGVQPVSANPSTSAKKLLCYLYQIYGTSVLSGQHGTTNNIFAMTGKYPAILGQDFLVDTATNSVNYWNNGGIPLIRYHMGAPPAADSYDSSLTSTNLNNVLTAGTAENASLLQKLDRAATYLQTLKDAGAPVLWAPFHEVQANGWFWWSKGTGQQFIQLWRLAFDYLTTTKGLNNLIWLLPYSGSPTAAYYPGKAYVDIAGADTYGTNQPFTQLFSNTRTIVGTSMPIPLHETGTIPDPDAMFGTTGNNPAPWVFFNVWYGYETSANTPAAIQHTYAHSRTITRDELPSFR